MLNAQKRTPSISIVMPLYNKAADVVASVMSVLAQTIMDWELIVIDDGSTDGGADLVRALSDDRISVVVQENSGVSAARNRGVQQATAEVVAFLDADDLWHPEFIECILQLKSDFPEAHWFATAYEVHPKTGAPYTCRLRGLPQGFARGLLQDYFRVAADSDPPVWTSAVAIRRESLLSVGGFPHGVRSGEDLLTWARLAVRFPLAYELRPLAVFVASGIQRAPDPLNAVGHALEDLSRAHASNAGLRRYAALWYRMQANMSLRFHETARARRLLLKSLKYDPLAFRTVYSLLSSCFPHSWRPFIDGIARRLVKPRKGKRTA